LTTSAGGTPRACAASARLPTGPCRSTYLKIDIGNTMFKTRLIQRLLVSSTKSLATDADLPDYVP
jgi:hypothetical protein